MPTYITSILGNDPEAPQPAKTKRASKPKPETPPPSIDEEPTPPPAPKRKRAPPKPKVVEEEPAAPPKRKRAPAKPKVVVEEEPAPPPPKRSRKSKPQPSDSVIAEVTEEIVAKGRKKVKAAPSKQVIVDGEVASEPPLWFKLHLKELARVENAARAKKDRVPASEVQKAVDTVTTSTWNNEESRHKIEGFDARKEQLFKQMFKR